MEKNLDNHFTSNLLTFLNRSPSPYQAVRTVADVLGQNGFAALDEGDPWSLRKGGKYYVVRDQSSVVAFETGDGDVAAEGFRVVGAHTDSPSFKIKPGRCLVTPEGYIRLNVEAYGGAIYSTWFDRPLSIAGRVALARPDAARPRMELVDVNAPVALIPNLCIHFNRKVNEGYAYNAQVDLLPLLGKTEPGRDGGNYFLEILADWMKVGRGEIVDYDLYLYETQPGCRLGVSGGGEYVSASRIDNLASVFAGLDGLCGSAGFAGIKVLAAFDNEEIGSGTRTGADSGFLMGLLERIGSGLGLGREEMARAVAHSLAISADAAHAVHPNYPDRHDPVNRPVLGGGPTIKYSAARRYATDAETAAVFARICAKAGIPVQRYVNRSDVAGGSTIGPALARFSSIPTVDVGAPILAMHSIRELANAADVFFMAQAFGMFFVYSPAKKG